MLSVRVYDVRNVPHRVESQVLKKGYYPCVVRVGDSTVNINYTKSEQFNENQAATFRIDKDLNLFIDIFLQIFNITESSNKKEEDLIGTTNLHIKTVTLPSNEELNWYDLDKGGEALIGLSYLAFRQNDNTAPMERHPPPSPYQGMDRAPSPYRPSPPPSTYHGAPPANPPVVANTVLRSFLPNELQRENAPFAKGSYGLIFKGHAVGIPKIVVIKDMQIKDQKTIDDWRKEVSCMAKNRSPYIVEVYGYAYSGSTLTIVMEYMPKGDLYHIIHSTNPPPLSILQRLRMGRHIVYGISFLHKNQIMHRDIKSMNVLITDDFTCKLTDFGCAKLIQHGQQQYLNTINAGTPMWMAPEVKTGGVYGFPADVYSLGLVLYELFEKKASSLGLCAPKTGIGSKFSVSFRYITMPKSSCSLKTHSD